MLRERILFVELCTTSSLVIDRTLTIFFYDKFDDIFFRTRTVRIIYDTISTVPEGNKGDN